MLVTFSINMPAVADEAELLPDLLAALHPPPGVPANLWESSFVGPLTEFLSRPGKRFRGQLTRLAWALSGRADDPPAELPLVVELLHAGSLIIDDIEDGSLQRRGRARLHRTIGVPAALNLGNWLYFWPFDLIRRMELPPAAELAATRVCLNAVKVCHEGQAPDLAASIGDLHPSEVISVCRAISERKTGALMGMAAELGATAAGADDETCRALRNADLHHTYANLYRDEPRAVRTARRLERMTWSMSLMVIYFGTKIRYPDLAHHTILFGPRYQGLLDDIFHGNTVAEDFSLYLYAPSVTDPEMAPPGSEAFSRGSTAGRVRRGAWPAGCFQVDSDANRTRSDASWYDAVLRLTLGLRKGSSRSMVRMPFFRGISMNGNDHEHYMRKAIDLAARVPERPFAAVIVDRATGAVVAEGWNRSDENPIWHGEIDALNRLVSNAPGIDCSNFALYTTAEPCPMCQGALLWAGIGSVVFGSSIRFLIDIGWRQIDIRAEEVVRCSPGWQCPVVGGILESECNELFLTTSRAAPGR